MPTINLVTEVPGPKSLAMVARREAATARGASKLTQVAVERAEGAAVVDVDGNTLLDFAGGIGVLAVGHCPPNVVEALQRQAAELMNEITPGDFPKKTVLLNSGAEALETCVKISRAFTGRPGIIVFEGAYHGRTNMTLSMTSKYGLFKKSFGPFAPEIYRLPFPNVYRRPAGMTEEQYVDDAIARLENAFIAQIDPSAVAAIVIETVQGEGGFIVTPPKFLQRIRELCTQHGIVYVADEVQCGFGRTGKLFAVEHYGIAPDLIASAKSLAAGMPLAAVTGKAEIMDGPHPGGLGGTYSGNPLACVAAIEAIGMIRQPEFLERATQIGDRIRQHLNDLEAEVPLIGNVRGLGAMMLMELVRDRDLKTPAPDETLMLTQECLKRGLIAIRSGLFSNCIRFLPPLNITDEQVDEAMGIIAEALRVVESHRREAIKA